MSRPVSALAMQAMLAQDTDQVFVECITITHPSLANPIYICNDNQDCPRSAGVFKAFPFSIKLPDDNNDTIPQVTLICDAVDQSVAQAVTGLAYPPPSVTYEIVLAGSPDTVEAGPFIFDGLSISNTFQELSATLGYAEDFLNEPCPGDVVTPNNSPGMFA